MKKEEKRQITIVRYCDLCKQEITENYFSRKTKTLILDFHAGYGNEPNCFNKWEKLDLEEKSDIISLIKTNTE